jgi:hypothetical protein
MKINYRDRLTLENGCNTLDLVIPISTLDL